MILRGNPMGRQHRLDRLHIFDLDIGLEQKMEKPYKNSAKPYGYCKGIVLLFVDSVRLAVWNPSTQQYRKLRRCPIKVPQGCHCNKTAMGLGYDSSTGEYKVVLIEEVKTDNNVHDSQVWIFGLRSNSWRRSSQAFPHRRVKFACSGYFADGSLYWLCRSNRGQYALIAFDIAKETISEVSEPLYPYKSQFPYTDIHVLDGRLCMSFFSWNPLEAVFYVREKDGQWNKLFSITLEIPLPFHITLFREVKVLGYWKEGDNKIVLDCGFKFIALYDLKEKTFTTTEERKLIGDVNKRLCYYPFLCHQSLVSVRAVNLPRRSSSGRKRKNMNQQP
ncbi:F-box protein At4g22390-like [Euphorbia lathyris]|uniref:F-box protein At4g22390-like n=1 Tax=Euphorbia lathyris TaxID=212925 RepID=UPI003313506A